MMFADLIDQDDLFNRLRALGIALAAGVSLDEAADQVLAWFAAADETQKAALKALLEELQAKRELMLPDVTRLLEERLLPLYR